MHSVVTTGEKKRKQKAFTSENMWPWGLSEGCEKLTFRMLQEQWNRPGVMT